MTNHIPCPETSPTNGTTSTRATALMKTQPVPAFIPRACRIWKAAALALLVLPGAVRAADPVLNLLFASPATNSAPGANFEGNFNFSPTDTVVQAFITAGTHIVPQSNISLDFSHPPHQEATNGTVFLEPLPNVSGTVTGRLEAVSGGATDVVSFVVVFKPYPPQIGPISNKTMPEDGTTNVAFTVTDPDTDLAALTLTRSSSNTALIDTPQMTFGGGTGSNRYITLAPKANINGTSVVTLAVSDGVYTNTQSFTLVVTPVADPPTIAGMVNSTFNDNVGSTNVYAGIDIDDVDHNMPAAEQLVATAYLNSDQFAKFANNQITYSRTGTPAQVTDAIAALALQPIPAGGPPGTINTVLASVRVRGVADGITVTNTVTLSIEVVNSPPTFQMTLNPTSVVEGASAQPFYVDYISDPDVGEENFTLSIELADTNQAGLIGIGPVSVLTDNVSGLKTAIRNVSVYPALGVMTNPTEQIAFRFTLTDGYGGSAVVTNTLVLMQRQNVPLISGIPSQTVNTTDANPPFKVYPTVFIEDQDQGGTQPVMATLTQSKPALGTISPTNLAFATPAQLTAALRAVTYAPTPGALPVGATDQSTLTLKVTDVTGLSSSNGSVIIRITGVNNAPQILNVPLVDDQPVLIPPAAQLFPFAGLGLSNDDTNPVLFTLKIDNVNKGSLTNLGAFSQVGTGIFEMSGSVSNILASLTNVAFVVSSTYLFPPDDPGGTTFTLAARDYALLTTTRTLYVQVQQEPRNHLVVRELNDGQPGCFAYALAQAGNNDVITFALPAYPAMVRLPGTTPNTLIRNVTIKGPGANLLTISGDGNGDTVPDRQLFRIRSRVTIEGVTLARGTAAFGGAIQVESNGVLVLRQCAVVDSVASQYGGAIDVDGGQLTLDGCYIARNRLSQDTGLSGAGVSVYSDKAIAIVNTTFDGNVLPNESGAGGGALVVQNRTPSTLMDAFVTHATFVGNMDESQRASAVLGVDFGTRVKVLNSVFGDFSGRNLNVAGTAKIVSQGGNVCDDSTKTTFVPAGLLDQATDATLVDPLLAPVDLYGDPTPFHGLLPGSPAIGRGQAAGVAVDQRGVLREGAPDAGAIEFDALGRLVINEIFFDDTGVNFIELFVRRDSTPLDLAPYSLFVDGVKVHDFTNSVLVGTNQLFATGGPANTLVNPGFGFLLAFTNVPFMLTSPINPTPVVKPSVTNAALDLKSRGVITIGLDDASNVVARQSYLGTYLDPATGTNLLNVAGNSISLAPQFRGYALVPHSLILPGPFGGVDPLRDPAAYPPTSPGADASGTPFGQDNAEPLALPDYFTVTEDDLSTLDMLANDYDSDGTDRLVLVDASTLSEPGTGDAAATVSALGAAVAIEPGDAPLRGERILYDPRGAPSLEQLPVGVEIIDTFHYEIIDIGSGSVEGYAAAGSNTAVMATNHRLKTNELVTISGAAQATYNQTFAVDVLDENTFIIPVEYVPGPIGALGTWETAAPRAPTARSETLVSVRVIGVNDPPVAMLDVITNVTERSLVRLMTRPELAGSALTFPWDPVPPPAMLTQDMLGNDTDVDTDDTWASLRVVGVLGAVNAIAAYSGTPGQMPVTVHAPGHGLNTGEEILIANYGGHPSYNGYHGVRVLDADTFAIPRFFVDDHPDKGVWVRLDESNRYEAVTDVGSVATLTLRADPREDHIIYNATASAYLQGLAEGELYANRLYYAVEDRNGGIGIGPLDVVVVGVNNPPEPQPDPDSLDQLDPLVDASNTLENVLSGGLDPMYVLPPQSGATGVTDLYALDASGLLPGTLVLRDFLTTGEDSSLAISTADLLANDTDPDRIDVLHVIAVDDATSRLNASLALAGGVITYDPTVSSNLQALVREELAVDTFSVVVSDGMTGGTVTSLVAVLVIGANDTPVANPDFRTTHEDEVLVFDPRTNDVDIDIDGLAPDDRLAIVAATNVPNPGQARVDMAISNVMHDATVSELLNQLADWQSFTNRFNYTITDNSFLLAVNDEFYVPAGTQGRSLDVLANDRDYTDAEVALTIINAGPALHGGLVEVSSNGTHLIYSSPADFAGDDYFRYTIQNDRGDVKSGRVMVRSVVPPLNGILDAADDAFAVAAGETVVLNVLANDNMRPLSGTGLTIAALVDSSIPGQPVLTNNTFVFAATNGLASLAFTYEISAGGTSTARAHVVVDVVERRGTLGIQDDNFSVLPGSFDNELDVLANDGLATESTAGLRIKEILEVPAFGTLTTNAAGTRLVYSAPSGFIGTEQVRYLATDRIGGTGTGTVAIVVGRVEAVSDFYTIAATTNPVEVALRVRANDRIMPNPQGSLTVLSMDPAGPTAIGTLQVGGGGTLLLFTPSNAVGQLDFNYVVQDAGVAPRTATGRVTIATVPSGTYANPDLYVVRGGGSGYVLNVLTNDVGYPAANRSYSILSLGTGADAPDHGGAVSISGNALLYTPATGFFGEESFTYLMSDSVSTDVARVTVSVRRGELFANDDDYAVFYELQPGTNVARRFTLPVLLNDRIQPPLDQITEIHALGEGTNAPNHGGLVEISPDRQTLLYRPVLDSPTAYVEQFTYEISDGAERRASGVVRVRVENRAGNLVALTHDDAFAVARNSASNALPVLANDYVLPGTAAGWQITGVSPTLYGGTVAVAGTTVLYAPATGFVGMDRFTYNVNDGLGGTGSATVSVRVGGLPTLPSLFATRSDVVAEELDVLANDMLQDAYAEEYVLDSVFGATVGGTLALSGANTVLYTPAATPPGPYPYTETFFYRIADDSGGLVTGQVQVVVYEAGSDRSTAEITLLVEGRNDRPFITNNAPNLPITDKQTAKPFVGATIVEVDEQLQERVDVAVSLDDPAKGILTNLGAFVDRGGGVYALTNVTAANATLQIRELIFVPTENRITVPTTETTYFTISVTDNKSPPFLDTNTAIAVTAVNDPPVIFGTVAGQEFYYKLPVNPFPTVIITEVDDLKLQPLAVAVTIVEPRQDTLTNLGSFVATSNGVYMASNLTAAAATAQLRAMAFLVGTNTVPVGGSQTTHFTLVVNDGFAPPVEDTNTSVIARNPYEAVVRPTDPLLQGSFGLAVDAIADFAVVGAPNASVNATNSGAAFIYKRVPGVTNTWQEWRQLHPATLTTNDRFGRAVAMTEDLLAVGAINSDVNGTNVGAVYLYERNSGGPDNWGETGRIAPIGLPLADRFGLSVALEGDLLAVGAPDVDFYGTGKPTGAVLLFARDPGSDVWSEVMRWAPSDAGSSNALFGWSVALSGDQLVVGAPQYNAAGSATVKEGAVFCLSRNAGGPDQWGWVQTIIAAETNLSREFGWEVSLDDGLLAVGAPTMTAGGVASAGRVFIYETTGTDTFAPVQELNVSTFTARRFGYGVSVNGSQVFVGAPYNSGAQNVGAAYLYERAGPGSTNWNLIQGFTRPAGSTAGLYGSAVRYDKGTAIVGAPSDLTLVSNQGYAFIYRFDYNTPPVVAAPIPDQAAIVGQPFLFAVPPETFFDADTDDGLRLSAFFSGDGNGFFFAGGVVQGTPVSNGTVRVEVIARDLRGGAVTAAFQVVVGSGGAPATPRAAWNQDQFGNAVGNPALEATVWGGTANPDGDFADNDREYAFAGDPNEKDAPGVVAIQSDGAGNAMLTYDRRSNDPGLVFILQSSADLVFWADFAGVVVSEVATPLDAESEHMVLQVEIQAGDPMLFYRIRAEQK